METTSITWRETGGASRPGHYFYWHLLPLLGDLVEIIIKMLRYILLILQFLPFLASSTFQQLLLTTRGRSKLNNNFAKYLHHAKT